MADVSNLTRGRAFREAVALTLALAGVEGATPAPIPGRRRASEVLAEGLPRQPEPHILGIPGWSITTHSDLRSGARWGTYVDAAEQLANLTGAEHFAAVTYRRERPTSEAFVVTTVDQLARFLATESSGNKIR